MSKYGNLNCIDLMCCSDFEGMTCITFISNDTLGIWFHIIHSFKASEICFTHFYCYIFRCFQYFSTARKRNTSDEYPNAAKTMQLLERIILRM